MNDALIVILSIIGFFALYWVLFGQWKYNKRMRNNDFSADQMKVIEESKKDSDKEV